MTNKLFKIVPDSRVKATGGGYYYVAIEDDEGHPHSHGMKLPDRNKRYIYEHIAKMELHLGRYLNKTEQVDHRDCDKSNNDMSNLKLVEQGSHQKDHVDNRGNHFWKTSPLNKPKRKKKASEELVHEILLGYLNKNLF